MKKRAWSTMTVAMLLLTGCGASTSDENSVNTPVSEVSSVQTEDSANAAAEEAAEAIAGRAAQDAAAQASADEDPFPYTAVLSCGMNGFENINLMACMSGRVGTEIELNNNGDYGLYKVYNLPSDWQETDRGVEIPLAKSFSIKMQNSSESLIMGLRVFDNNGNVLFEKQAARWGVITVSN